MHHHLILACALLNTVHAPAFAQPGQGAPPPKADAPPAPATTEDPVLAAIKSSTKPSESQWATIQPRYEKFRADQSGVMRQIRRTVLGDTGRPAEGQRPQPPTAEQRAAIDKLVAEKIEPLNKAFLLDVRATLTPDQQKAFDEASSRLDLTPTRGGPGLAGPGGQDRPGRQGNAAAGPLPPNSVTIDVKDGVRTITSNGIPDHAPGKFPGRGNPNAISAQSYTFRVTANPKVNEKPTPHRGNLAGVALNGVVFDPGTAEAWKNDPSTGWRQEAISPKTIAGDKMGLDASNAHVQPNGAYHYHAAPDGLIELQCKLKGVKDGEAMILIGWSADGFPIYDHHCYSKADDAKSPLKELHSSYRLKAGVRPDEKATPPGPGGKYDGTYTQDFEYIAGSGDLDECNGRFGVTPEFPLGTYYYVVTGEFPFVSRMFRGTPDPSFGKRDHPPGGGRRGGQGERPATPRPNQP